MRFFVFSSGNHSFFCTAGPGGEVDRERRRGRLRQDPAGLDNPQLGHAPGRLPEDPLQVHRPRHGVETDLRPRGGQGDRGSISGVLYDGKQEALLVMMLAFPSSDVLDVLALIRIFSLIPGILYGTWVVRNSVVMGGVLAIGVAGGQQPALMASSE